MKGILPLLMIVIMAMEAVVPVGEMTELLKLPELVHHYQAHRQKDQSLSLIAFINLHYGNVESHENESHNHDRLPFSGHHQHNCQLHQLVYTLPEQVSSPVVFPSRLELNESPVLLTSLQSVATIWQPPRSA
jgi:hypothetical protein